MTTLDDLLDLEDAQERRTRDAGRVIAGYLRVGLWSLGWLAAKAVVLLLTLVAALFFAAGWLAAKAVPAVKWARAAIMSGWEAGRPSGGVRGPA